MRQSESIAKLAEALAKFHEEVKNPANTANNPFYKSKYAPLGDVLNLVRPLLGKQGLSIIQNSFGNEQQLSVSTLLLHNSGEFIESDTLTVKPEKNTPQGIGSAITYLRRYQISSVLDIASEDDDDGNSQEKEQPKNNKSEQKPENKKEIKNDKPTTPPVSTDKELEAKISEITSEVTKLRDKGMDDKQIGEVIKGVKEFGKMNYAAVKDVAIAQKILETLKNTEVK